MDNPATIGLVAAELELLSAKGEQLHTDSARSTIRAFSPEELVLRNADFGAEYLALQHGVSTEGLAAVVTAGPPGAGKSTLLEAEGLRSPQWRNIDADLAKEIILRRCVNDGIFDDLFEKQLADGRPVRPMELATLVHRESASVVHNVTQVCLRRGENIVIQGTLVWQEQPERLLASLEDHGYEDLTIVDVEVDLATALAQSRDRWWAGRINVDSEFGGRFTPSELIRGMYLTGGMTKCRTNAEFMFAMSTLGGSRLVTSSVETGSDVPTRTVRTKIERDELPSETTDAIDPSQPRRAEEA